MNIRTNLSNYVQPTGVGRRADTDVVAALFGPNPMVDPAVVPDNTITVCVDT